MTPVALLDIGPPARPRVILGIDLGSAWLGYLVARGEALPLTIATCRECAGWDGVELCAACGGTGLTLGSREEGTSRIREPRRPALDWRKKTPRIDPTTGEQAKGPGGALLWDVPAKVDELGAPVWETERVVTQADGDALTDAIVAAALADGVTDVVIEWVDRIRASGDARRDSATGTAILRAQEIGAVLRAKMIAAGMRVELIAERSAIAALGRAVGHVGAKGESHHARESAIVPRAFCNWPARGLAGEDGHGRDHARSAAIVAAYGALTEAQRKPARRNASSGGRARQGGNAPREREPRAPRARVPKTEADAIRVELSRVRPRRPTAEEWRAMGEARPREGCTCGGRFACVAGCPMFVPAGNARRGKVFGPRGLSPSPLPQAPAESTALPTERPA